ncbi:MAG: cytochrome c [candidate division NC10 bacterium]|nr:cytochrome c [candidate division NC10 bacterium]
MWIRKLHLLSLCVLSGVLAFGAVALPGIQASAAEESGAHSRKDRAHDVPAGAHMHPPVPAEYAKITVPPNIWTDADAIARGRSIHAARCAVCHGAQGAGDGPAAASLPAKPASFQDRAMAAEMTEAYWFWRVSEGGAIEPFKSAGSAMPPWKQELSVEDRWTVIAYQHSLSGHAGPHVPSEHPGMMAQASRPHPEPRGLAFRSQWVTRDHRWQPRGPWKWAVQQELTQLYREFNGIDFGHAHLGETLLKTQDSEKIEKARLEVLDFIFSSPAVPPDEEQVAPTMNRLVWEVSKTFDWAHLFHRSLYDLFASDKVEDKEAPYRKLLADYLEKPEAITPHRLDHHRALWSFPESKAFRDRFRKFNTQIWAYHWLQAAVYDVQLLGKAGRQREMMPRIIAHYHGYLRRPPVEWEFMPMMPEGAPEFSRRFPEAAAIFDNLHMLHDNLDDILTRPDLYPTMAAKRAAILKILPIYLHRNHSASDLYADFHEGPGGGHTGMQMGPRPPSVAEVLAGTAPPSDQPQPAGRRTPPAGHKH